MLSKVVNYNNIKTLNLDYRGLKANLPTVDAYYFTKEELIDFIEKKDNEVPYVLDINIKSGCILKCIYCFTHSKDKEGRFVDDDRFGADNDLTLILNDSEIEEVIKQYAVCGGKTILLCSNGEPLMNKNRVINLISIANYYGLKVFILTNMSTLNDSNFIKNLCDLNVSLGLKYEHVDPTVNNRILGINNDFYKYIDWKGVKVPKQLAETFEIYHGQGKSNCLAISSMLMYHNYLKIPVIRQWTYEELGIAHFLKQIYNFGNVYSNTTNVVMSSLPNLLVNKNIYSYDNKMGFIYPDAKYCADEYSYDARRILNNLISDNGFPFRIATHIKGFYLSADSVSPEFGIDKNKINLSLRKKSWHADSAIEVPLLFKNISEHISIGNLIKKWQEELNLIEESFLADHSNISSTISSTEDSRNIRYENAYQLSRKIGKLSREKNSIMSESEIKEINRLFAMAKRFARENVLFFAREQGLHVVNDSYYRTANVNGEMFYFFALHRLPYYDDYYQITLSNTPDKSEQEIHGHYFTEELTISLGDGLYFNKYELSGDQLQKETKVSIPKYFAGKFAPLTPHSIGSEDFAITPNVTVKFFEAIMDRWSLEEGPEIDKYNFNYFLEKSHITYEGEDYKILKHIKPGYAEISIIELNPNYSFKKKIIEEGGLYVVSGSGISQYKDQKKDIKANDIVYLISNKKDEINILNTSNYPMVLFSLETIIDFN